MKAVQLVGYGDIDQLVYGEVPMPEAGAGEVLVKVVATSVNPVDWKIRSGMMKAQMPVEFPFILGRDVAGEIVSTGQKVIGFVTNSYAEYLVAKEDTLAPLPDGLPIEDAGALPLVLTTGSQLIEKGMGVTSKQMILVTGALGSVGRTAVYVAKQHGATVIAGVRGQQRAEALSLGADQVVAIDSDEEIGALPPLDGVADTIGGEVIAKLLPKIKAGGVVGSVLGPVKDADRYQIRVGAITAQPDATRLKELAQAVAEGKLTIAIGQRFPLREAAIAQRTAEKGGGGKVLLLA